MHQTNHDWHWSQLGNQQFDISCLIRLLIRPPVPAYGTSPPMEVNHHSCYAATSADMHFWGGLVLF